MPYSSTSTSARDGVTNQCKAAINTVRKVEKIVGSYERIHNIAKLSQISELKFFSLVSIRSVGSC